MSSRTSRNSKRLPRNVVSALILSLLITVGVLASGPPAHAVTVRDAIVTTAQSQLGKTNCSPHSGYYNSCGIHWCANFARWVWSQAGVTPVTGLNSWAQSFKVYGFAHNTYHARSGYTPQPGDAVIFDWNPGQADDHPIDHVAIVTAVSGGKVYYTGGNQGSGAPTVTQVTAENMSLSSGYIDGYVSPANAGSDSGAPSDDSGPKAVPGFADVNGDGRSDLIAQNSTDTWVRLSNGAGYNAPAQWSNVAFYGSVANHVGDVNGDGRADLIAQNDYSVWVMTSTGNSFNAPTQWSAAHFGGAVADHVGDITGDGRADLIAQNGSSVWVMTSTGSSLNAPAQWSTSAFYGSVADHVGDITGDGRADLIAQNGSSVWVMTSTGSSLNAPAQWSTSAFYGSVADHVGDITGDGRADLIAQNGSSVWVMTSTGSSLNAPAQWSTGAFHGTIANHG
ncbi:FG-GAP-like repeat-containing protein [Micromonospora sp. NBC_01813]|uniref:FG-GAP-like repeat-containing protein n=1 Tax=Micromonospora sp. NBC_01813 TaxID=2975988 RepID=UPI002DD977D3|nr:FG-GAP-like repeat-containing protein [Micromonospora sp. NBC_01813]WSA07094.1 FG-GAP-like repeat-containing protein [Micromonospora sp. NBC_01813]